MGKNEAEEAVSVVSFISSSLGVFNWMQLTEFGLLNDRTSSVYLEARLKSLASAMFLSDKLLYKFYLMGGQ